MTSVRVRSLDHLDQLASGRSVCPVRTARDTVDVLTDHLVCANVVQDVFSCGRTKWKKHREAVEAGRGPPTHGSRGGASNQRLALKNDASVEDVQAHFEGTKELSEPRATRFVRESAGNIEVRDASGVLDCSNLKRSLT